VVLVASVVDRGGIVAKGRMVRALRRALYRTMPPSLRTSKSYITCPSCRWPSRPWSTDEWVAAQQLCPGGSTLPKWLLLLMWRGPCLEFAASSKSRHIGFDPRKELLKRYYCATCRRSIRSIDRSNDPSINQPWNVRNENGTRGYAMIESFGLLHLS
jgi:DNA-directed RNA polymerase subunit RPC12/RpoP